MNFYFRIFFLSIALLGLGQLCQCRHANKRVKRVTDQKYFHGNDDNTEEIDQIMAESEISETALNLPTEINQKDIAVQVPSSSHVTDGKDVKDNDKNEPTANNTPTLTTTNPKTTSPIQQLNVSSEINEKDKANTDVKDDDDKKDSTDNTIIDATNSQTSNPETEAVIPNEPIGPIFMPIPGLTGSTESNQKDEAEPEPLPTSDVIDVPDDDDKDDCPDDGIINVNNSHTFAKEDESITIETTTIDIMPIRVSPCRNKTAEPVTIPPINFEIDYAIDYPIIKKPCKRPVKPTPRKKKPKSKKKIEAQKKSIKRQIVDSHIATIDRSVENPNSDYPRKDVVDEDTFELLPPPPPPAPSSSSSSIGDIDIVIYTEYIPPATSKLHQSFFATNNEQYLQFVPEYIQHQSDPSLAPNEFPNIDTNMYIQHPMMTFLNLMMNKNGKGGAKRHVEPINDGQWKDTSDDMTFVDNNPPHSGNDKNIVCPMHINKIEPCTCNSN